MNIQNWKEHSKVLELKAKLEDRKIRGILKWIFQIVVTLVFAAVVALHVVPDCDHAGKFNGTDNFCR